MAGETTANAPGKAETDPEDTTAETGDGEKAAEAADGKKEEEEEECGFCKFMKGGSCKTAFVAWEDCVDKAAEFGQGGQAKFNIGIHMTDAAIVRLLDVAGYIDFSHGGQLEKSKSGQDPASSFYTKVPRGWTFDQAEAS